jgi:hypothetical protein
MGTFGGLLGLNGGVGGTGIAGPTGTPITAGTNAAQLATAQQGAQAGLGAQTSALGGQQQLLSALQAQNGLGNQSQVYNQLQGIAAGTGPNPAQAQLAQATGANAQQQAAMQASQRGAGGNVGLMARNAGMIGANAQQQSAGQAATLQAQQSLNALGQAGGIANQQTANQIGATGAVTGAAQGLSQGAQGEQNILQGANTAANNANVSMQGNINSANAGIANTQLQGQQGLLGGVIGGAGAALGAAGGGVIPGYDSGGDVSGSPSLGVNTNFGVSTPGSFISSLQAPSGTNGPDQDVMGMTAATTGAGALQQGTTQLGAGIGKQVKGAGSGSSGSIPGGSSSLTLGTGMSPGAPSLFGAHGGKVQNLGDLLKQGGKVPGTPKVKGNSYKNDTVKALVSPGEVVIPNSVMQAKDPVRGAADFVRAILAKKGRLS